MAINPDEKMDAACGLLRDVLGYWYNDERRKWCAYCGIPMKLSCSKGKPVPPQKATRDHVIPRKHHGRDVTIPACRACNQAKGTMSMPEFLVSDYFAQKRKHKHKNQWAVEHLWMVTALAAAERSRGAAP